MNRRRGGRPVATLVLVSLLAAGLGWFVVSRFAPKREASAAPGAVDLFSCPMEGAQSIGQLQPGDDAWLIGVSDGRWGVIRHPDDPTRPAWVPLAQLGTNVRTGGLPEMSCDVNPATATTATTATTAPPTTVVGSPTTSSTTTSTTSSTTSTTSTTIASDRTPPTVTVTPNREYLYVTPAGTCAAEAELEVSVAVVDPTLPVAIRSIVANWTAGGALQTAGLTPVAGNRFKLTVAANGPTSGETPLTITVSASDGAGNIGNGTATVSLRAPGDFGCT
jgi:hypothetical protein